MKKIVTLLSLFLCLCASSQPRVVFKMVQPYESENTFFADDSVAISFSRTYHQVPYVQVENLTKNRIYIEWENARYEKSRIAFGEDSRISMRYPKADEMIPAGEKSSSHSGFYEEHLVNENGAWNPFNDERIFEYGKRSIEFLIPIRFSNGSTRDYKMMVIGYVYNDPVDYSGVQIGMKTSEVKALLGRRPDFVNSMKGKRKSWNYYGCVTIIFEKGLVAEINPIVID